MILQEKSCVWGKQPTLQLVTFAQLNLITLE